MTASLMNNKLYYIIYYYK